MTSVKPFIPPLPLSISSSPTKKAIGIVERRFDWENQFAQGEFEREEVGRGERKTEVADGGNRSRWEAGRRKIFQRERREI